MINKIIKLNLFFIVFLNSQTTGYLPLDIGNEWTFGTLYTHGKIKVVSEELINGKVYKLVYCSIGHPDTMFLRQEDSKVYHYSKYDSLEILYYDFTAPKDYMFFDKGGYFRKCIENKLTTYLNVERRSWGFVYGRSCVDCSFYQYLIDSIGWYRLEGAFYYLVLTEVVINGKRIITKVDKNHDNIIDTYYLSLVVYPNPFNPNTTIQYSIPTSSNVRIDLYDILGQKKMSVYERFSSSGLNNIILEGNNLSSGMYFLRLLTASGSITKKVYLLK
ncbi:MAG: T9SS type A sorting domain-containing protein [Bacteroidota bacterium]